MQETQCNRQMIEQFLADGLSAAEQATFEAHLGECPACRQCLDELAADRAWWQEARGYLSGSDSSSGQSESEPITLAGLRAYLAPTDDPRHIGRLGGYGVVGLIGCGGMGIVLKGFDAALNRYVAIKLLSPQLAASGAARQRFAREARAAAAVVHDNVVAIHAVAESDGLPYFVMPYSRGPSLESRLRQTGPLATVEVVRIGMQIAAGLAAAHAQGLVHRDIKPANILLEEGIERVTITDFGLARAVDDASLTRSGVIAGTPQYMSPEQAAGQAVDHRSDLFSLGSVLYAMCTGRPPFRADTTLAVLRRVEECRPRPIREINPDIPEWLERVVKKLHAKEPADRLQTAGEVAALLEAYLAHLTQPTVVPAPRLSPGRSPESRPTRGAARRAMLPLVAVVVVAAGLTAWLAGQGPPSAGPKEVYVDFRSGRPQNPDVKWAGMDGTEETGFDDRGLRIKLTAERTRKDPGGMALIAPVVGDFEVTAGYELLSSDPPKTGQGIGFELFVQTGGSAKDALALGCVRYANGRLGFWCSHNVTVNGERKYEVRPFPATQVSGRLQIQRVGNAIVCRVAEGTTAEFTELTRFSYTTDDLTMVRVGAYPGQSTEPVETRLVDLRVRATGITSETAAASAAASRRRPWTTAAIGIGLFAVLGLLLAAIRRRRLRAAAPGRTTVEVTPPAGRPATPTGKRWPGWLTAAAAAGAVVAAVGLAVGLAARRSGPGAPSAATATEFYQDFRAGHPWSPDLEWAGRDGSEQIGADDRGLRIKLPGIHNPGRTGVLLTAPVRGDFDITAGYELLTADPPKTGKGIGFELVAMTNASTKEALVFGFGRRVDGRLEFWCSHDYNPPGSRRVADHRDFPASETGGRLQLVRAGRTIICRVAEGNSTEFRELVRFDFGTDDLAWVRLAAYPGQAAEPVDVRLVELRVKATAVQAEAGTATSGPAGWPKRWLTTAAGVGLFVILGLGLVGMRRALGRKPAIGAAARAEPPPPLISFTCPECGAAVKAPAEFAGKKGKCPKCGRAVPVPAGPSAESA